MSTSLQIFSDKFLNSASVSCPIFSEKSLHSETTFWVFLQVYRCLLTLDSILCCVYLQVDRRLLYFSVYLHVYSCLLIFWLLCIAQLCFKSCLYAQKPSFN